MNMDEVTNSPLCWPKTRKRTPAIDRRPGRFSRRLSVAGALDGVMEELRRLDVGDWNVIVSTNLAVRLDGMPRSNQRRPDDPGVAVYFRLNGEPHVLACDKWKTVEHNLRAIALHIEATRALARWGVGSLREAFAGYKALPVSAATMRDYFAGIHGTAALKRKLHELVLEHHPDRGGSNVIMAEINRQYDVARVAAKELEPRA